ncbi:MAG: hydroxyacid dehydrogenase [Thermoplasmata archaeon]|nr:hydroxyacid dehydrogenase [Thermoplasmata archaeon]
MPEAARIVVIADPIDRAAVDRLRSGPCTVVDATAGADALRAALPTAWALVVRSRTKVTEEMLRNAPHLRLIARAGVGVDNIDMSAVAARSIDVVNTPSAATASVAELTVAFALMLVRRLWPGIVSTKAGGWERGTNGGEIAGRTIGYIGYGRIAREVQRRLIPFGVRAVAYDPFLSAPIDATELVDLPTLLGRADIVSLHASLTPENHHLMDARALEQMRPGAVLINVARGPLVDETALLAALKSGRLAGAALDVFDEEPPRLRELLERPDVIATPHIGASTREGQARAGNLVVDEILRAARAEPLTARVLPPGGSP